MMLVAFLLLAAAPDWVPARWFSNDPATLELLRETPVNCVLLEKESWSAQFAAKAREAGIATLGVLRPPAVAPEAVNEAAAAGLAGLVIEGDCTPDAAARLRKPAEAAGLHVIELLPRARLDLSRPGAVTGTYQGLWPGIHTTDDGAAKAAPTGAPWIETNTGFLRFARASTSATLWIGNLPPEGNVIPAGRYAQAIGDAAMAGGRWILALDSDLRKRLLAREAKARDEWRAITAQLSFWEKHRDWTLLPPCGGLAVVLDVATSGLLSGGILDMITARHTPLRTIPPAKLSPQSLEGARLALNSHPGALSAEQTAVLRDLARRGGTMLTAPPGWTFTMPGPDQFIVDDKEVAKLDDVWRGVNMIVGRDNLGVRLFNVASMRSELVAGPGGRPVALHLVNYADYPVENITVKPDRKYSKATLYTPEAAPQPLEIFENGDIDIAAVRSAAILVMEGAAGPAAPDESHDHRH